MPCEKRSKVQLQKDLEKAAKHCKSLNFFFTQKQKTSSSKDCSAVKPVKVSVSSSRSLDEDKQITDEYIIESGSPHASNNDTNNSRNDQSPSFGLPETDEGNCSEESESTQSQGNLAVDVWVKNSVQFTDEHRQKSSKTDGSFKRYLNKNDLSDYSWLMYHTVKKLFFAPYVQNGVMRLQH